MQLKMSESMMRGRRGAFKDKTVRNIKSRTSRILKELDTIAESVESGER